MVYNESHIEQELARLYAEEETSGGDRGEELRRLVLRELRRLAAVRTANACRNALIATAWRMFECVDSFLVWQNGANAFPIREFIDCQEKIRWRFCADALRDERVPRATKAQLVAWMMYLPVMNVPGRSEALVEVLDEDSSRIDALFPALPARVEYCRRRLPDWREVAVSAGEDANPAAYGIRYTWENRLSLMAEEESEINRDDGPRFALAMSLSGHRISKTLLLGLVFGHRWSILKFLYGTFDACQRVLPANEVISRICSDGEILIEGHTTPWQVDGDAYAFTHFLESRNPGCTRKIRDPFGNDLLWQTLYRAQTSHRASKVYPKLEKMLVDLGCNPHETTRLGVSWADVARAQYQIGITKSERDWYRDGDKKRAAPDKCLGTEVAVCLA